MNHKKTLGPIVNTVNGLHIRQMLDNKGNHNGKYGIYAGKRLYQEHTAIEDAGLIAAKSTSNKPTHFPFRNTFLKWRDKK